MSNSFIIIIIFGFKFSFFIIYVLFLQTDRQRPGHQVILPGRQIVVVVRIEFADKCQHAHTGKGIHNGADREEHPADQSVLVRIEFPQQEKVSEHPQCQSAVYNA